MLTVRYLGITMFFIAGSLGCSNQNEAAKKTKLALESRLSAVEQAEVVAVVGERVITLRDLERQLNAQTPLLRDQYGNAQRKLLFLTELVRIQLLANEAEKHELDKDPVLRESMVTLLSDAMVDEVGRKALRESPVSEIELQKLAQEKGIEPTNLDALSDLRHRLVRERKERAVKLLLESNQAAREIRFEGDAWSAFKRAHETKRKR